MARQKKTLTVSASTQPTPKAKATRSTKGGDVKSASPKPRKFQGVKSGMKVMEYQDHTLTINNKSDRRLSDSGLADDWATEFPQSECMQRRDVKIVGSVRRLYNQGKHRKGQEMPKLKSVPYGEDGKILTKPTTKQDATAKAA
jgi:hypothetical protein